MNATTILVVDLEATCWFPRNTNNGQKQEIIEIGCARLNIEGLDYQVEPLSPIYVQPQESTISSFCTELTGITQTTLDLEGCSFKTAMGLLLDSAQHPIHEGLCNWASFGLDDRLFLQKQCDRFGVAYPLGAIHYDIQALLMLLRGDRKMGLNAAIRSFGLTFEGRQHNGVDDAVNAARVLGEMVKRYRMKEIK